MHFQSMLIKYLHGIFCRKILTSFKGFVSRSDSKFDKLQSHLEWQDSTRGSWGTRGLEVKCVILYQWECHEHPCCHLFSISLQFLHDISWKAFRNCFFLTNQNQGSTYILVTAFSCKTLHCLHFFKNSKLSPYMTSSFICSYIQKWAVLNMSVLRSSHLLKYIC